MPFLGVGCHACLQRFAETIASFSEKNFTNFWLFIVDDGLQDRAAATVRSAEARDRGLAVARASIRLTRTRLNPQLDYNKLRLRSN